MSNWTKSTADGLPSAPRPEAEGADRPLLASATIIRVVVDTEAFLERLGSADGTDSTNP
tara:strand:- start:247 stop:423 length:177 start_codon:yes stop_codon:yes gene_type:complete